MIERTDEDIAAKVQQGDAESFGLLIERNEPKITRYARKFLSNRDDIADLVQEVFVKAYVNIQSFDTERRFSPWLYRIAHNEFVNALRKQRYTSLPFFDPDAIFPHPIAPETADGDLDRKQTKAAIERSLGALDQKYREPLILHFFEDLGYQEIAEILHVPVSTVGVRILRGKSLLRKIHNNLRHI